MIIDFTAELVNRLIGVEDSTEAPQKLWKVIFDKQKREKLFHDFLQIEHDLSYDWFQSYFEDVQADRKKDKQDFTPNAISDIILGIQGENNDHQYFEPAVGTGGMMIRRWDKDRQDMGFFNYKPSMFFYRVEDRSNTAMPFLLFNCLIRGMNITIFWGDSLDRTCKDVFFIQNDEDNSMGFSKLNVMPRSEEVKKEFKVSKWLGEHNNHIESTLNLKYKGAIENDIKTK